MLDYYNLLQVAPEAAPEVVRAAFRREAKRYHPDAHPHAAPAEREARQRRFILLAQAYDTLSDPAARAQYDRQWRARFGRGGAERRTRPGGGAASTSAKQTRAGAARRGAPGARETPGAERAREAEGASDWNDLVRDTEHLLRQFGLDLRLPLEALLERLLQWALELYREVTGAGTSDPAAGSSAGPRGSAPGARAQRSAPRKAAGTGTRGGGPRRADPETIERELAELKRKAGRKER